MPGPPPKPRALRQRRNHVPGARVLPAEGSSKPAPPLPARACPCEDDEACKACGGSGIFPWHQETIAYWRDVWSSPMATEYIPADVHGLVALFKLIDRYNYGEADLAAEIRLQRVCFGLTPIDRRRMQWEIEKVEQAQRRRPTAPAAKIPRKDPRHFLKAIK